MPLLRGLLILLTAGLNAQAASFNANGVYLGAAISAHARGLEAGIGSPILDIGPALSSRCLIQKVDGHRSLRASICLGVGTAGQRWYLHAGPALGRDPVHGGQAGVAAWGAVLVRPSLYAGLDVRALWSRSAADREVTLSLGWHLR